MGKEEFLKNIATKGYDVGFGAKKNFASFDIINKLPSWVGFTSFTIGVIQLGFPELPCGKTLAILLIISSMAIMYIDTFKVNAKEYEQEGVRLTKIFNKIKDLYLTVKSDNNYDYLIYKSSYDSIINEYYQNTIGKQVFMSQWYAHFKFFYEHQIEWIDEQLHFKFFKDKIPNSLKTTFLIILMIILITLFFKIYGYCPCI